MPEAPPPDAVSRWLEALEARHLADLRPVEVARALRALSSAYVERRDRLSHGAALDGAGKRAAFALFYAPLHFLLLQAIVRALGAGAQDLSQAQNLSRRGFRPPETSPGEVSAARASGLIVDLGCGTGVAGAAWALERAPRPRVLGIERHPWAADEARWTCRTLGIDADIRCSDIARVRLPPRATSIVAAFTVNEIPDDTRARLLRELLAAHGRGAQVLIVEPIAKGLAPWWPSWADAIRQAGGREDQWRFPVELPGITGRLDRAAGLDHRELTGRSLFLDSGAGPG